MSSLDPDLPIKTTSEDKLNREPFCQEIKNVIMNASADSSFVIGLRGQWGEGKSSVINIISELLQKDRKSPVDILEFNPWMYPSEFNLTQRFFDEFSKVLEKKDTYKGDKEIAKKLRYFGAYFSVRPIYDNGIISIRSILKVAAFISYVVLFFNLPITDWNNFHSASGFWISFFLAIFLSFFGFLRASSDYLANIFESRAEFRKKTLSDTKKEIKNLIKTRKRKVLVVIDDLDRLDKDEVYEILRIVKANADFPNTIYLLSYDHDVLSKCLDGRSGERGEEYLEKIIQVTFDLPEVNKEMLHKILFSELDLLLEKLPEESLRIFNNSKNHWKRIYINGFKDYFTNIRDIRRYMNAIKYTSLQLHPNNWPDVNPVDLFAIQAIRVFDSIIYERIYYNKANLLNIPYTDKFPVVDDEKLSERAKNVEEIFEHCSEKKQTQMKNLLQILFPQIEGIFTGNKPVSYIKYKMINDFRICTDMHFETYFTGFPGGKMGALSNSELRLFLKNISENPDKINYLLKYKENGKLRNLLERLFFLYVDEEREIDKDVDLSLVSVMFELEDLLSVNEYFYDSESLFGMSINNYLYNIVKEILIKLDSEKILRIIAAQIDNISGLFSIRIMINELLTGSDPKIHKLNINKGQIDEIKNKYLERLFNLDLLALISLKRIFGILPAFIEWGFEEQMKKHLAPLLNDAKLLIKFVEAFTIQVSENTNPRSTYNTNITVLKDILHYIDKKEVKQKFDEFKNNFNDFSEGEQKILESYLAAYDTHFQHI